MDMSDIFISSCSRRQLARRRPPRSVLRVQLLMSLAVIVTALAVLVAVNGGI
jgi:hypothetical protein